MLKGRTILFLLFAAQLIFSDFATAGPEISSGDRIRLAEAFHLANAVQDNVWDKWSKAPFSILLVTKEHEFLLNHPDPPGDFKSAGKDPLLNVPVFYRKPSHPLNFQATFPLEGIPTIVIGTPAGTQTQNSVDWVLTVMHEHFHQLQYSQPGYYAKVNALELSGADQTGMWMLNYPFPYEEEKVAEGFHGLASAAIAYLNSEKTDRSDSIAAYLKRRSGVMSLLNADQRKYMEFQLWQEGISRYTQWQVAQIAASTGYTPTAEFQKLADYKPYRTAADGMIGNMISELVNLDLKDARRVVFYPLGAAEGMMLDEIRPDWKKRYLDLELSIPFLHYKKTR